MPNAALSSTAPSRSRGLTFAFWAVTVLFCLQLGFTAWAAGTLLLWGLSYFCWRQLQAWK